MPITTTFEARYLDRAGLKALLDKLFPGNASFAVCVFKELAFVSSYGKW